MLYRLMVARGHPEFAAEQAVWLIVGLASFVLALVVIRDVRQLDAYTYTIGLAALILLLLPIVPGVGTEINGAKLWVNLGFVTFQPAEAGRILIVIFLASYLSQRREMLAAGVGRLGSAATERSRAADPRVGCVADRAVPGARHGRVAAVVRRVRGDDVGRDRPVVLLGARARAVRDRRLRRVPRLLPRAGAGGRAGCTRWTPRWSPTRATSSRRAGSRSPPAGWSAPVWVRARPP